MFKWHQDIILVFYARISTSSSLWQKLLVSKRNIILSFQRNHLGNKIERETTFILRYQNCLMFVIHSSKYECFIYQEILRYAAQNLESRIARSFILLIMQIWRLAYNTKRYNVGVVFHEIMEDV